MKKQFSLVLAFLLSFMLLVTPVSGEEAPLPDEKISILFLNVGKADAILVMLPDSSWLIDTGTKNDWDTIERALLLSGIRQLDGVIISHTDKDHIGGLKKLLKSDVDVKTLYCGALHCDGEEHPAIAPAGRNNVPLVWLSAGDELAAGTSVFRVLGPLERSADSDNDNSLVILLETPVGNVLFTGDMTFDEENTLLTAGLIPKTDVLKVAHHGRDDATGAVFAMTASPAFAVISTDIADAPSTADSKVISRLWKAGAQVFITQNAPLGVMITLDASGIIAEYLDWSSL